MIRVLNATKVDKYVVIEHLEYYINKHFAETLFDSCKSIYDGKVMNMMCGEWGHQNQCSAQRWLSFMGLSKRNGGYSPFQMDVKLTDQMNFTINQQIIVPMNDKAFKCNEAPTPTSHACDCIHCPEACVPED